MVVALVVEHLVGGRAGGADRAVEACCTGRGRCSDGLAARPAAPGTEAVAVKHRGELPLEREAHLEVPLGRRQVHVDPLGARTGAIGHLLGEVVRLGGLEPREGAAQVRQDGQERRLVEVAQPGVDRVEQLGGVQQEVGGRAQQPAEEADRGDRVRAGTELGAHLGDQDVVAERVVDRRERHERSPHPGRRRAILT
ncbi:hypothetical protein D3C74_385760 [compost metagenome]